MPVGNHPAGPVVADGPRIAPPGAPLGASAWGPTTTAGGALTPGIDLRHISTEIITRPIVPAGASTSTYWTVGEDVPAGELWHIQQVSPTLGAWITMLDDSARRIFTLAVPAGLAPLLRSDTPPGLGSAAFDGLVVVGSHTLNSDGSQVGALNWVPDTGAWLPAGWTWAVWYFRTPAAALGPKSITATIARYQIVTS